MVATHDVATGASACDDLMCQEPATLQSAYGSEFLTQPCAFSNNLNGLCRCRKQSFLHAQLRLLPRASGSL